MKEENNKRVVNAIPLSLSIDSDRFIVHVKRPGPDWDLVLMERNGKGMGMISIDMYNSNQGYIYSLSVEQESRRQGLGNKMMDILENGMLEGLEKIRLYVDRDGWEKQWYERRGYVEIINPDDPGDPFVNMEKTIKPSNDDNSN